MFILVIGKIFCSCIMPECPQVKGHWWSLQCTHKFHCAFCTRNVSHDMRVVAVLLQCTLPWVKHENNAFKPAILSHRTLIATQRIFAEIWVHKGVFFNLWLYHELVSSFNTCYLGKFPPNACAGEALHWSHRTSKLEHFFGHSLVYLYACFVLTRFLITLT